MIPLACTTSSGGKMVPLAFRACTSIELSVERQERSSPSSVLFGEDHAETANRCDVVFPTDVFPLRFNPQLSSPVRSMTTPANPAATPRTQCAQFSAMTADRAAA